MSSSSIDGSRPRSILWSISTFEDMAFCRRFAAGFEGRITTVHSNFVSMLGKGVGPKLPPPKFGTEPNGGLPQLRPFDVARTFNVVCARLDAEAATGAYWGTIRDFVEKIRDYDLIVVPSGRHVHQIALTHLAEAYGIRRVYIGYGNLPRRTIFDPHGTDADSLLYADKDAALAMFMEPPLDVEATIAGIMETKRRETSIPQKSNPRAAIAKKFAFFADTVLQMLSGRVCDRRVRTLDLGGSRKAAAPAPAAAASTPIDPEGIFFPLQVSSDTQVLTNYDGHSIFRAIDEVAALARSQSRPVFYRAHPAESDPQKVEDYITTRYGDLFHKTTESVHGVFDKLDRVVTINSTVGLEAKALGKDVSFLGRSLYASLSRYELAVYLARYLVEVDYFRGEDLDAKTIDEIFLRAAIPARR